MRKSVIAGNWKLHKTQEEALALVRSLKEKVAGVTDVEIIVAPPFTALPRIAEALAGTPIALAAQNCYPESTGAFTGEISPLLLKDCGCSHVIVGHSERRQIFGESDEFIQRKVQAVLAAGLTAILCIGETLEEREGGRMFEVLSRQLRRGLQDRTAADLERVIVAYEPVWAIGTGKTASDAQAQEAHAFIRSLAQEIFGRECAEGLRLLYGGSVKPDNAAGLMAQPDIDGTLVGGASLKADDFAGIVRYRRD